jgi:hypothetical protein
MDFRSALKHRPLRRSMLAIALGASFTSGAAFAQSNASGVIFGRAEAAAGTTVLLENLDTGLTRDIQVAQDGRYRASSLPVGRYRVSLRRDGNVVDRRDNVQVNVGSGTDVSFAAASAGAAHTLEGVQVVANALPPIDVSAVDSRTVLTADQLQKIPVARNVTAAALLAPGTVQGDSRYGNVASFGGASAAENQYYINGFSVTNALTGIGSIGLPFDAIDQQQVFTGGYGAEYGRSTGGVVNVITKRGGNEWKAGALLLWSPRALADSPRSIYRQNGEIFHDRSRNKGWEAEYAAYISGPLIKDKLFFYATADITRNGGSAGINNITYGTKTVATSQATRWLGKIDWNITDSHILELTALGDKTAETRRVYGYDYATGTEGAYRGVENLKNYDGTAGATPGGDVTIAKYTGYLSDNLTVNALYGKSRTSHVDDPLSASGRLCPGILDTRASSGADPVTGCGIIPGGSYLAPGAKDSSTGYRLDLEYRLGDHTLRAGVDNQTLESYSGTVYEGGARWSYNDVPTGDTLESLMKTYPSLVIPEGATAIARRQNVIFKANVKVEQEAQFIEDRWQISDRWLAYIGLRNEQFKNFNGAGEVYVKQRHQLAPRLGISWDVFGDSSMKVYANAGRYHLAVPANVAIRAASASIFEREWFSFTGTDPITGEPTGRVPISDIKYVNGADGTTPDTRSVAARNLKAYYQDEYILGFDKQLGNDWAFGAKATLRKLKSSIDDFCDSRPFERYAERNGIDITGAKIDGCFLFNPGQSNEFLVDVDGKGDYQPFKLSKEDLGFPALKRKYYSLDMYLEHRFTEQWYGKLQYVFSRSYGNSEGMLKSDIGQLDPSVTQDWDFPELSQGANGPLPNDRTHAIKAYGYYQMTPEWMFGTNIAIASGRPKNCIGRSPNDPYGYDAAFFYCDGKPTPRGSQGRLPWTWQVDLSAEYRPRFADHQLAFTADVFNLFSKQRSLSVWEYGETATGTRDINYLRTISFQSPRYVRLGVRYDFSL